MVCDDLSMNDRKKGKNKKPKIIKITPEQLVELTEAIRASNLDPKIGEMIIDNISGNRWLVNALEKGQLSIKKLRALFNITTESFEHRKKRMRGLDEEQVASDTLGESAEQAESEEPTVREPKKRKGHGRLSAAAYLGAEIVEVNHPNLKRGDPCPEAYCDGRLYELSDPGVMIQVTGAPIARATKYELQKLRCSVCELIFTAPLPEGIEAVKYTTSLIAMLMIHKYFMSVPLYRQETLQHYLGVPLPASTQWELMAAQEDVLKALYSAFEYDAAQGRGLSIDDTKARILEQMANNKKAEKKLTKPVAIPQGLSVHMILISLMSL